MMASATGYLDLPLLALTALEDAAVHGAVKGSRATAMAIPATRSGLVGGDVAEHSVHERVSSSITRTRICMGSSGWSSGMVGMTYTPV